MSSTTTIDAAAVGGMVRMTIVNTEDLTPLQAAQRAREIAHRREPGARELSRRVLQAAVQAGYRFA